MVNNKSFQDLILLFANYKKYWYLFALSLLVCLGGAYAYLKLASPIFQVSSNILIKENAQKGMGGMQAAMMKNLAFSSLLDMGGSGINDELEVINSYTLRFKVVKELGLNKKYKIKNFLKNKDCYSDSPLQIESVNPYCADTLLPSLIFKVKVDGEGKATTKAYKGRKLVGKSTSGFPAEITTVYGSFIIKPTSFYEVGKNLKMDITFLGYGQAAENLGKVLQVDLVSKKADVISITIPESNRERGMNILNELTKLYNEYGIESKNILAKNTSTFLEGRIATVANELHDMEKGVELYKKNNNLTDLEIEAKVVLEANSDFKEKIIEVETQYAVIDLVESFLKNPENKYAPISLSLGLSKDAGSSSESLGLYNTLLLERLKLLRSTNEENPTLKILNEQIAASRQNVLLTINSLKTGIERTRNDLRAQEQALLNRMKIMPTQEREFIDVKRLQLIKQELFVFLLQKQEENSMILSVSNPKAQVIDAPYCLNEPLKPRKNLIAVFGLLLGLIIPTTYLFVRKEINPFVVSKKMLQKITSIAILGEIENSSDANKDVVFEGKSLSIIEAFRSIRANLLLKLNEDHQQIIQITSLNENEGKTFFSVNLASSLAALGKKVVLIEADTYTSKMGDYINRSSSERGLTDYLCKSDCTIDQIVVNSEHFKNLSVIFPGSTKSCNLSEMIQSDKMLKLLETLKLSYDYIIISTPSLSYFSENVYLNGLSNLTVCMCRMNLTKKSDVAYINELVADHKLNDVAFALNGVDHSNRD